MIKKLLIIFLFVLTTSCAKMTEKGYIKPKMHETANMVVSSNGFRYTYRQNMKVDMTYYITIKFKNINSVIGNYIMVEFQDPQKLNKFYKYIQLTFLQIVHMFTYA